MYISEIQLQNYRGFSDATIQFNPGVNVIIGENNAGKTTILCALRQVFSKEVGRKLDFYDIYHGISDFSEPPLIQIVIRLTSSSADTDADRALVAQWMTSFSEPWQATLTYQFFLPEEGHKGFKESLGDEPSKERYYQVIEEQLPKFIGRVYGGNVDDRLNADPELLKKFGCQFLDALRDAESELTSGKNQLLKEMLRDVLDKKDAAKNAEFSTLTRQIKTNVTGRLNVEKLFELIAETGAADGGELIFEGNLSEAEFLAALELYISRNGIDLPINRNGLGYNNLVYISLVLAKLDADAKEEKRGQNTKIFPMLLLEEPEAHLHPSLQYRLLKYLRSRLGGKSRQAFITTHSTQITSACTLDEIICMTCSANGEQPKVAYPGRVFDDTKQAQESKQYIERYLDATKSNMLFSRGVIFVEGLAELLIVPRLADLIDCPFEEHLVAIISVDGSTFKHFLPLFGACSDELKGFALDRRVACLPDADPAKKVVKNNKIKWPSCYPYEMDVSKEDQYRPLSPIVTDLTAKANLTNNIQVHHGHKTLEYDLALDNAFNSILVTESCKGKALLHSLCLDPSTPVDGLSAVLETSLNLIEIEKDQKAAKFATLYLMSTKDSKGSHALELAAKIKSASDAQTAPLNVPSHIVNAIRWVCHGEDSA